MMDARVSGLVLLVQMDLFVLRPTLLPPHHHSLTRLTILRFLSSTLSEGKQNMLLEMRIVTSLTPLEKQYEIIFYEKEKEQFILCFLSSILQFMLLNNNYKTTNNQLIEFGLLIRFVNWFPSTSLITWISHSLSLALTIGSSYPFIRATCQLPNQLYLGSVGSFDVVLSISEILPCLQSRTI